MSQESLQTEPIVVHVRKALHRLTPKYVERRHKEIKEVLEAMGRQDIKRMIKTGHNLRGSGGGYGLPEISKFGEAIEEAAHANDWEALQEQVNNLANYLTRLELVLDE